MPYCQKCGTQIVDDAQYCYKCGTHITNTTQLHTTPTQTPAPSQTIQQQKTPKAQSHDNSLLTLTVIMLIVTLLILIIALAAYSPLVDIFNNTTPTEHPGLTRLNLNIT